MSETLKRFEAICADRTSPECLIVTIGFSTENEEDALDIAKDMALLEGYQLIICQRE